MDKKIKRKCAVCGEIYETIVGWNGECKNCGWFNNLMGEDNENKVIYPNMLSLSKAQELYKQGKPLRPSLSDFLDGFWFYGETTFQYKDYVCDLIRLNNEGGIIFGWDREHIYNFSGKEDFIKNAKIENEYVRDIWDEVIDPHYM